MSGWPAYLSSFFLWNGLKRKRLAAVAIRFLQICPIRHVTSVTSSPGWLLGPYPLIGWWFWMRGAQMLRMKSSCCCVFFPHQKKPQTDDFQKFPAWAVFLFFIRFFLNPAQLHWGWYSFQCSIVLRLTRLFWRLVMQLGGFQSKRPGRLSKRLRFPGANRVSYVICPISKWAKEKTCCDYLQISIT